MFETKYRSSEAGESVEEFLGEELTELDRVSIETLKSWYPTIVVIIGTVGAQMTFAVVLADLPDTASEVFAKDDFRKFVVASWSMFVTLIFSGFAGGLLGMLNEQKLRDGWFKSHRRWLRAAIACNIILITVGFAAFGCMAAAMTAYTNAGVGGFAAWQIGGGYLITILAIFWYIAHLIEYKYNFSNIPAY
ncbi:hypothetical protein B0H67DRAFT_647172 [Lasiosphaeris hirsuta]|uniref:Uncharacterized protein n=1 Tax=Lasiosphaeris hirsuta TaxID=260670 RepID=A0AA40DU09_9PEZI|nr:hypothetical protein B0H67DRAFT_647172 [Lasiosphaeris hirsuta]